MSRKKYEEIPREIAMPVYWAMIEDVNADNWEIDEENGTAVYDFEEMANELENRICKKLNRNVLITISELEDDMDKDDMDINDLTFNPTMEEDE